MRFQHGNEYHVAFRKQLSFSNLVVKKWMAPFEEICEVSLQGSCGNGIEEFLKS